MSKIVKIAQNTPIWSNTVKNGLNRLTMYLNNPKFNKMVKDKIFSLKMVEMVKNWPKKVYMFQNGLKLFKYSLNSSKIISQIYSSWCDSKWGTIN